MYSRLTEARRREYLPALALRIEKTIKEEKYMSALRGKNMVVYQTVPATSDIEDNNSTKDNLDDLKHKIRRRRRQRLNILYILLPVCYFMESKYIHSNLYSCCWGNRNNVCFFVLTVKLFFA